MLGSTPQCVDCSRCHLGSAPIALQRSRRSVHSRQRALRTHAQASSSPPLVVVGSVNADLVLKVDRIPSPGETLGASSLDLFPGGKGANQAAAAAKLGYPTHFLGQAQSRLQLQQTGTDANADTLRAALAECGVNLDELRNVEGPSGTAIILLQPSGENSIIIVGGANQAGWDLQGPAQQLVTSAGAILLQREIPEEVNTRVAEMAATAGVPVYLDAGGIEAPISDALLRSVTVLSPNETELARLTGMATESEGQIEAAARKLQDRGVDVVLVKLGKDGSMLIPGKGQAPVRQQCVPAPAVVDTTGAGDCFTAGFAVARLEGMDYQRAMLFAAAAASLCVRRAGAMPSLPLRQAVDELLATL